MRPLMALLGFLPVAAFATSIMEVPFPETVQDAPVIARGKIGKNRVDYAVLPGGGRRIYTFYDFDASEVLKGSMSQGPGTIREMGGEKDGTGLQIPGAAQFSAGEDVVVMLSDRNADGSYDVRGLMVGKLNIKKDENGQEVLTGPAIGGLGGEHGHAGQADPAKKVTWNLDQLRKLISDQAAKAPSPLPATNPPTYSPLKPASPHPVATASRLQTTASGGSEESERDVPSSRWVLILGAIAIIGVGVWLLRRSRL